MATFSNVQSDIGTNALARAISAFSDQEYTDAVRIAGTSLVGSDARISTSDEDYFGTIRWTRTLGDLSYGTVNVPGATQVNIASETDDEGLTTDVSHDVSQYVKTMRTMGATQFNVTEVLTQAPNAIEKVSRDFGISRSRDADAALLAMLQGVTDAEKARRIDDGTTLAAADASNRYGQGPGASSLNKDAGFYVDLNGPQFTSATSNAAAATSPTRLIDVPAAGSNGGMLGSSLWEAASAAYGDLEPDFFYLLVSTQVYQQLRSANLLSNQDRITDGSIVVDTLLGGKFRVIQSRSLDGSDFNNADTASANAAVNAASTQTSYLMLPGALYQSEIAVPNPVAFDTDESVGRGAGNREIWYRWGNIWHPRGYTWSGSTSAFATNATYATAASWQRKEAPGNLGILPIFHA